VAHLNEGVNDEPRPVLGEVHEDGLKPDPEPVSLPLDLLVRSLRRLPVPLVGPCEHTVVRLQAGLDLGGEAPGAAAAGGTAVGGERAPVSVDVSGVVGGAGLEDDVVGRAHFGEEGARDHDYHENRVEELKKSKTTTSKTKGETEGKRCEKHGSGSGRGVSERDC